MKKSTVKFLKNILCMVLIVTLGLSMPFSHFQNVFAEDAEVVASDESINISSEPIAEATEEPSAEEVAVGEGLLEEYEEKREENVKHFYREDGLVEAVYYPYSVHYNKDGVWTDIDNSLVEKEVNGITVYENTANSFKISFSKDKDTDSLVSLNNDGSKLSWAIPEMDYSNPVIETVEDNTEDIRFQNKLFSKITYEDAINGVDVTYMLTPNGVKEYFIIENEEELESFNDITIVMKTDGLDVSKTDNKLHMKKNGADKFTLSEPVMFDSSSEFVSSVPFEVKEITGKGERQNIVEQAKEMDASAQNYSLNSTTPVPSELPSDVDSYSPIEKDTYDEFADETEVSKDITTKIEERSMGESIQIASLETEVEITEEHDVLATEDTVVIEDETDKTNLYVSEVEELIGIDEDVNYFTYTIELDKESIKEADITYPLVIDPDIVTDQSKEFIEDTYISSIITNPDADWIEHFKVGYRSDIGVSRSYVRMTQLPPLVPGDMVVGASLVLYRYFDENRTSISYDKQINIHEVTESWPEYDKFVWGNEDVPSHNSKVESTGFSKYFDISTKPVNVSCNIFDITKLVKAWYSGEKENYGVMLKNADESANGGLHEFFSSQDLHNQDAHPYISVVYVNSTGIESTYSYHELAIGRAGTAYINDATGNATLIHEDCTSTDGKMPIQLSHVFDNNYRGTNVGYGVGWRINYDQTVEAVTINEKSYYKYVDGDGTIHYYYKDGSVYYDEGNKLNKLTVSGSNVIIEDTSAHIKYTFVNCKLKTIADANGNTITINRNSSGYISEIIDPSSKKVTFTYSGDKLDTIKCPNNEVIDFNYAASFLTEIVYPDGEVSKYAYHEWCLDRIWDIGGYKVDLDYNSNTKLQVNKVTEYADEVAYNYLTFDYKTLLTTVTDNNGKTNHYRFNKYGQLINEQDYDGSAVYYDYETSVPGKKNNLNAASDILSTSINLVSNSSFENNEGNITSDWVLENSPADVSTPSTMGLRDEGYIGEKSLYLLKTNYCDTSKVYTSVSVTPGNTYTVSLYFKGTMAAYLYAEYNNASGNAVTKEKEVIYSGDNWFKNTLTVTIPSDAATSMKIGIVAKENVKVGVGMIDAVQVSETGTASRYNLIKNPDFRSGLGCWAPVNFSSSDTFVSSSEGAEYKPDNLDNHVVRIYGDINTSKSIYQLVAETGEANDSYIVGAFAKTTGIPKFSHTNHNSTTAINYGKVILRVEFQNGSTTVTTVEKEFSTDTSDWQYLSFNAKATATFTRIKLSLIYDKNLNTAYFDGVSLYKDGYGTAYTYDSNNNLERIVTKEGKTYKYEYDTNNNLLKSTDEYDDVTSYTYDSKHNVKTVTTTPKGLSISKKTEYSYDSKGNVTQTKTYDSRNLNKFYISNSTYDGNYKKTDTDARNNQVSYDYDSYGRLNSVIDSKDEIGYDYGTGNKLETVATLNTDTSVTYVYDKDDLSEIQIWDSVVGRRVKYGFTYNTFGQLISTKVNDQVLGTNTYDSKTKLLKKVTYGNDYIYNYNYNDKEQLTSVTDRYYQLANYEYDDEGRVSEKYDLWSHKNIFYDYDDEGRLIRELKEPFSYSEAGRLKSNIIYTYDERDRVNTVKKEVGDYSWTETYGYDDTDSMMPSSFTTDTGVSSKTEYDDIGRISSRKAGTGDFTISQYTYIDGSIENSTTGLIHTYSAPGKSTETYTYDETGLIKRIASDLGNVNYTYDEKSQLSTVVDYRLLTSTAYTYDSGGNITSKRRVHGVGSDSTSYEVAYTYDSTWRDLLVSYGGETIEYDSIGNPTKYLEFDQLSWSGRKLDYIKDGGKLVSEYIYDSDGVRVAKYVSGVQTQYIYTNGQLSALKSGDDVLYFTYDGNGNLVSVTYNDAIYYYVLNPQGDVVGLCNASGTSIASYSYDEWGYPISAPISGIGALNPFRYRGYIYDEETGFYLTGTRYYDPEVGRFINADDTAYLGCNGDLNSYNLFAYCGNNPVNRKDINGNFWVAALVGAAVNVATTFIAAKVTGQEYTWADFGIAALSGAVNAIPVVGTVLSGVITGTYAGYMSYANGATVGEAIFCGTVAGTLAASSISNLANISGPTLDVATTAFVDLVYGTAFNTISAATYKGITNNAQVRNKTSNNTNSVLVNKSSVPTPQKKPWKTKTYVYSYGVRI